MEKKILMVDYENVGKRLDLYLAYCDKTKSRSYFKRIIESEGVAINKAIEDGAGYRVKQDDLVEYYDEALELPIELKPEKMNLKIIEETSDYLVIDKAAGVVVHPSKTTQSGTIMNGVAYYLGKNPNNCKGSTRAGLVHRLDKDTSGVLLVAKNDSALWWLTKQFADRSVSKTYKAIVTGDMRRFITEGSKLSGLIITDDKNFKVLTWIDRNPKNRKKYCVVRAGEGRYAITNFTILKVVKYEDRFLTYLEVKPETGRTHQIRVHLSYLGFPIVGDKVYGGVSNERMLLHAERLRFTAKNGKMVEVKSDLPSEFNKLINDKKEKVNKK